MSVYDTIGLSESNDGTVTTKEAFTSLVHLLYRIEGGIHLLLCVATRGRLSHQSFKSNYKVFYEQLCEKNVPCLLVITHCEQKEEKEPMNKWWLDNAELICGKLKFKFEDGICITTRKTGFHTTPELYASSRKDLIDHIEKYSRPEPWPMDSFKRSAVTVLREMYNNVVKHLPLFEQTAVRQDLYKMFIELKFQHEDAVKEANKLYSQLKGGSY